MPASPRTKKDGPPLTTRDHLQEPSNTFSTYRIPSRTDNRRRRRDGTRKYPVTMRVTLLAPSGRRTMWWALGRCPVCGVPHLSRSPDLETVTRTRRLPCGHWATIVIARSLAPYAGSGVAA